MSLLATVTTHLGKIELHNEGGVFTTRRTYDSPVHGVERVCTILQSLRSAIDWYELAERHGTVHAPFPETETPERTPS